MQIDFNLFVQEKHALLGELDEKTNHIKISKAWNFEPNGCKGKYSFVYTNMLVVYIH